MRKPVTQGERFGRLTAICQTSRRIKGKVMWLCKCDCGTEIEVMSTRLRQAHSKSCGCLRKDGLLRRTHGHSRDPIYGAWHNMMARCQTRKNYADRGIKVCDRWCSVSAFVDDMGAQYRPGLTLERIDNNGPYAPENCRWATRAEQARNRRTNRSITFNGKTQTVEDWAKELGIHERTITSRIDKLGWSESRALTDPVQAQIRR